MNLLHSVVLAVLSLLSLLSSFVFFCSDVFVVVILHMSIVVAYVVKTLYGYRVNLLRYTSVYPSP